VFEPSGGDTGDTDEMTLGETMLAKIKKLGLSGDPRGSV
jgi:hypothetical protein